MSLQGRTRTAPRYRASSDEARPRLLAIAAGGAAIGLAALLVGAPSGSVTTPGPLSAVHVKANVPCKACHSAEPRSANAASGAPVSQGTTGCQNCHGDHGLRAGHSRALASGQMTCATCHPAHGAEAVTFLGDGTALHSTPAWTVSRPAAAITAGTTVPIVRAATCGKCHDPSQASDPLRACLDTSGATKPPLLVRCLGEHEGRTFAGGGVCAAQHGGARFAARDAAVQIAQGTSVAGLRGAGGLAGWLGLAPIAIGLVAYAGARFRRRKRTSSAAAGAVPVTVRKLPVIDASRCLGCYACVDACAFDVLTVQRYVAKVERPDACCGAVSCEAACPNGSLVLKEVNPGEGAAIASGPKVTSVLEAEMCPGVFLAGDVTGVPLIRNAVLHGRRAIDAVHERKKKARRATSEADVLIIGAGPAGLAASLRAEELGLSYVTLEQHAVAASIKSFPRGKLVFDAALELPLEGELAVRECTKEELVAQWMRIVRVRKPRILEQHRVVEAAREGEGFVVTYERADASRGVLRAGAIVIAIGQRGTPRRLAATIESGAESMVADALFDAHSFAGRRVVVVGLGDSAMEAVQALAHQPGTEVTVVHRGSGFDRGRARNIDEVKSLVESGRVRLCLESTVAHVGRGRVTLDRGGKSEEIEVDAVLALLGGTPSTALLEPLGIL